MKSSAVIQAIVCVLLVLGGPVAVAQSAVDAEFLEHALEAERFIESLRMDVPGGVAWKFSLESDQEPNHSFYNGSGGIALFYLELYQATAEQRFLEIAMKAGEELLTAAAKDPKKKISMNSGLSADVFVFNELYNVAKDKRYREAARRIIRKIKDLSVNKGSGVAWIEKNPYVAYSPKNVNVGEMYDLSIGAAGVGVTFLYAYRAGLDDDGRAWAAKIADRLLDVADKTPDGLRWPMMANLPSPRIMPNFAHGPAGIAYFFADLYTETKDQRYLDAAISAARYVQSRAVKKGDGVLVTHNENPEPADLYYLGVCHGPAGTGRLMYLLYQITGDDAWMNWIEMNLRGMLATGAPETRSEGLWNNLSQCCGDTGLGEFALDLYRATGKQSHLDLARRIARHVLSEANQDDGKLSWTQAEMRIRPEATQTQTGYMQGAAGMGSFFLHLATVEGGDAKIAHPAMPIK